MRESRLTANSCLRNEDVIRQVVLQPSERSETKTENVSSNKICNCIAYKALL